MSTPILEKKNRSNELDYENNQTVDSLDNLNDPNQANSQSKKPESGLGDIVGELMTIAPLLYERFTKKTLPAMGGTIGEMQRSLAQLTQNFQQLSTGLVTIVNNQNKIFQRIANLENNAQNGFLSLDKRIDNLKSLKLVHEKESKRIEYNQQSNNSALLEDNQE